MKISKDSRMAILALLPMLLVMSVPLLSAASTSAQHVSSEGQLIDLFAAYGLINWDDLVPYPALYILFGPFLGYYYYSLGTTWRQLKAWAGLILIPFFIAAMIFPGWALPLGLVGAGWLTVAA